MKLKTSLTLLILVGLLWSCEEHVVPKPLGYHRIDFPEKQYQRYQGSCPFEFDYPFRSILDTNLKSRPGCWMNLHYPQYKSTIHFTYTAIQSDQLGQLIEDSRKLAMKHIVKADNIDELLINDSSTNVYGVCYDFGGGTATNFQFFLTDSNRHFLRGSMYFNLPPNPDSLEPVSKYIKKDLIQLIESLNWTEV